MSKEAKSGVRHKNMIVWQMADKLDKYIQKVILKKIPRYEYKIRTQIDSASDSISANFVEGYYSGSLNEYIRFCKYSRRSIGELHDRVERTLRKEYIAQDEFNKFEDISIKTGFLFDRLLNSLNNKKEREEK